MIDYYYRKTEKGACIRIRPATYLDHSNINYITRDAEGMLVRTIKELRIIGDYFHVADVKKPGTESWQEFVGFVGSKGWNRKCGDYYSERNTDNKTVTRVFYPDMIELISLWVETEFRKMEVASKLVQYQLKWLKEKYKGIRIFCFTKPDMANGIFKPLGFYEIKARFFGPKVLEDCMKCPKNIENYDEGGQRAYLCDEIALVYPS